MPKAMPKDEIIAAAWLLGSLNLKTEGTVYFATPVLDAEENLTNQIEFRFPHLPDNYRITVEKIEEPKVLLRKAPPDMVQSTPDMVQSMLRDLGLTYQELEQQAQERSFDSDLAQRTWFAIEGLLHPPP